MILNSSGLPIVSKSDKRAKDAYNELRDRHVVLQEKFRELVQHLKRLQEALQERHSTVLDLRQKLEDLGGYDDEGRAEESSLKILGDPSPKGGDQESQSGS